MWEIYDPFDEMRRMTKEIGSLFRPEMNGLIKQPLVDIQETDKEVIIKADMPGVDKKDIDLNITEDTISIKAEKKHETEVKKKGFYRHERSYAGFARSFTLPAKVIADKTEAKMNNGVLEVKIPKLHPSKAKKTKKIEIK